MIELTFWGVRGSNPVSGKDFEKLGGHTSCVSVSVNQDPIIIFDAGSGLFDLGKELYASSPSTVNLFISHLHLDHIMGLPFFPPLWDRKWIVNVYSQNHNLEDTLRNKLLCPPFFPIFVNDKNSNLIVHDIVPDTELHIGASKITTCLLNHPGGAIGYRLEAEGHSICYITDVEHDSNGLDEGIIHFIKECDLFIYDSSYTEEEYVSKHGWGHSTHIRGAELAKAADVKKLALFHQNPTHTDMISDRIEKEAQVLFPNTIAAYQGLKLRF